MTGYPIMEPPFLSFPIEEMKKKQVEQHFNWYMTQIEGRIKQLNEFINLENKELVLDKTPESLIDLWEWYENHIEYENKTEEEINKSCEGQPEWFQEILRQDTKKMTLLTMALAEDIDIYFSETMIHNTICLYQTDDNHWYGKLYEETTFKKLLQNIKNHGYSLPTRREWEYLSGKGCRTIFPWGNNIDFSMNLKHMEWMDNDGEYTLEKENFFGLIIGNDQYCREIVYDEGEFSYKGGDGGRNICGGLGVIWGYLPVSPYFQDSEMVIGNNINGGYDFFRRVIRINDNMK